MGDAGIARCAEQRIDDGGGDGELQDRVDPGQAPGNGEEGARKQAAEQFAVYGTLPSYRAMLEREGYDGPADAAIIGDEATVRDRLDEVRAAGVDEFVAAPFDSSPEGRARTRALLRDYAPDN